jgi:hypothetical protein
MRIVGDPAGNHLGAAYSFVVVSAIQASRID